MSGKNRFTEESLWKGVSHSRTRHDVMLSPAWKALSYPARALYGDLRARLKPHGNGNVECTPSVMAHVGWRSKTTLYLALEELEALGFIAKTRQGGRGIMSKTCSLFRFTDIPCPEHPTKGVPACRATMDWRAFKTDSEAESALKKIEAKKARPAKKQKAVSRPSQGRIPAAYPHLQGRIPAASQDAGPYPVPDGSP